MTEVDKRMDILPKRKHPRLKDFDYSSEGAYFVTICTQNRRCILSEIVGRGLAPAELNNSGERWTESELPYLVAVKLTKYGEIAKEQLLALEERFPCLQIDQYVIMPNHIHVLFVLNETAAGASPRPTIMDIVCAYKSLTAIKCKKEGFSGKLFQDSFFDHVIKDYKDYAAVSEYIYYNPAKWEFDELYHT